MSEYSIYTITDDDRAFSESCAIVHCADDCEAIEEAAQWVDCIFGAALGGPCRFGQSAACANV